MANEIKHTTSITVIKDSFRETFAPNLAQLDMAGTGGGNPGLVDVGTSEEDIAFGDVTPALCIIQNLDTTNYVTYGPKSGGAMILFGKIKPGQHEVVHLGAAVTLRMQANTAAVKCLIKAYPD